MGFRDALKRFGQKLASATHRGLRFGQKVGSEIKRIGKKVAHATERAVEIADVSGLGKILDIPIKGKASVREIASGVGRGAKIASKIGGGVQAVAEAGEGIRRVGRDVVKEGVVNADNIQRAQDVKRYSKTIGGAGRNVIEQAKKLREEIRP